MYWARQDFHYSPSLGRWRSFRRAKPPHTLATFQASHLRTRKSPQKGQKVGWCRNYLMKSLNFRSFWKDPLTTNSRRALCCTRLYRVCVRGNNTPVYERSIQIVSNKAKVQKFVNRCYYISPVSEVFFHKFAGYQRLIADFRCSEENAAKYSHFCVLAARCNRVVCVWRAENLRL